MVEKKMNPQEALRNKKADLLHRQREAEDMKLKVQQDHDQKFSKFRVERSNVVKNLNAKRQGDIGAARQRADSIIANAKVQADALVAKAKEEAEGKFQAERDKVSAEFNAKANDEAVKFEADFAALRTKLLDEATKAEKTRLENLAPLEKEIAALEAEVAAIVAAGPTLDNPDPSLAAPAAPAP